MAGARRPVKAAPKRFTSAADAGHKKGYDEASRAFGGCKQCYGKGYSTQKHGARLQIHTCSCDRGKQLDQVFLAVQEGNAAVIV